MMFFKRLHAMYDRLYVTHGGRMSCTLAAALTAVAVLTAPAAMGQAQSAAGPVPAAAQPQPEPANLPTTRTTLTVTVSPSTFTAGQSTLITWDARNAAGVSFTCTAEGTGYRASGSLADAGSTAGVASAEWVDYPSTCVWTAEDGEGGDVPVTVTKVLTTVAGAAPPGVNGGQFISVTPPPASLTTGQSFSYSVTVKNTGTKTWDPSTTQPHRVGAISPEDNLNWGAYRLYFDRPVAPQETRTLSFSSVIPASMAPGQYTFQWQLIQEGIGWFGDASPSHVITVSKPQLDSKVTYIHTDALGSPVATTDSNGNTLTRTRYEPYGLTAAGTVPKIGFTGHVNDAETGLVYMQQRYYDPVAGRFLSIDPVTTDANTGSSFSRYAYANNNPYLYVDPDGRTARLAKAVYTASYGTATILGAGILGKWISLKLGDALQNNSNITSPTSTRPTSSSVPAAPGTLVGEQGDKAGPTKNGKRHTSGPLTPANGGTGDANKDFEKLTGGTGKPPGSDDSRSSIPGVLVGENGVWIRPEGKDGPRIEIPAAPGKLPETLHYPPETK